MVIYNNKKILNDSAWGHKTVLYSISLTWKPVLHSQANFIIKGLQKSIPFSKSLWLSECSLIFMKPWDLPRLNRSVELLSYLRRKIDLKAEFWVTCGLLSLEDGKLKLRRPCSQ